MLIESLVLNKLNLILSSEVDGTKFQNILPKWEEENQSLKLALGMKC